MAHYALIENNIVANVIVAEQDFIDQQEGEWVQTSYNTREGVHLDPVTLEPDGGVPLRANYASVGDIYNREHDVFHGPRPEGINGEVFNSWILNQETWIWEPPIPKPSNMEIGIWNEETLSWDEPIAFTTP